MEIEWPYAEVKQETRFRWSIEITNGLSTWGPNGLPHTAYGSKDRVVRKAKKLLRKYDKAHAPPKQSFSVYKD